MGYRGRRLSFYFLKAAAEHSTVEAGSAVG